MKGVGFRHNLESEKEGKTSSIEFQKLYYDYNIEKLLSSEWNGNFILNK